MKREKLMKGTFRLKKRTLSLGCCILANLVFSLNLWSKEKEKENQNEFFIDRNLVNQLYEKGIEKTQIETVRGARGEISPQFGFFDINQLTLTNDYFETSYSDQFFTMNYLNVTWSQILKSWEQWDFYGQMSLGYSFRRGNIQTRSKSGLMVEDNVTLQWIPFYISGRFSGEIPWIPFLIPSLILGAGGSWYHQDGNLDGINQGFLVPSYLLGVSFQLFKNKNPNEESSFGGLNLSILSHQGLGSEQKMGGLSYLLGLSIAL